MGLYYSTSTLWSWGRAPQTDGIYDKVNKVSLFDMSLIIEYVIIFLCYAILEEIKPNQTMKYRCYG